MTPYEARIKGIDAGSAVIVVELRNGNIIVRHGECGTTLKRINKAKVGSWDSLWDAINKIESVES